MKQINLKGKQQMKKRSNNLTIMNQLPLKNKQN